MKTICPHCNQIYDVEENWIGIELQCSVCQQHFLAENVEHLASSPGETAQSNIMQQEKYVVDKSGDLWHKMIRWFKEKCRKRVKVDTLCPHCGQKYELPKRLLNTQVTCTNCDQNFFVKECLLCPSCQNICRYSDEICKFCGTNIWLFKMNKHKSTLREGVKYKPALWKDCLFVPLSVILLILAPYFAISNFSFFAISYYCPSLSMSWFLGFMILNLLPFYFVGMAKKLHPDQSLKIIYPLYQAVLRVQCFSVGLPVGGCFNLPDIFLMLMLQTLSMISCSLQVFAFSRCFSDNIPIGTFAKVFFIGLTFGFLLLILGLFLTTIETTLL